MTKNKNYYKKKKKTHKTPGDEHTNNSPNQSSVKNTISSKIDNTKVESLVVKVMDRLDKKEIDDWSTAELSFVKDIYKVQRDAADDPFANVFEKATEEELQNELDNINNEQVAEVIPMPIKNEKVPT